MNQRDNYHKKIEIHDTIMKPRKILLTILIILLIIPLGFYFWITRSNGRIDIDGQTRSYVVYEPDSYNTNERTALVLSLHGFSDWPMHHMRMSGWNHIADKEGFIVVYPMGTGFPLRWDAYATTQEDGTPNADLEFLRSLIAEMQDSYNIDRQQIFVNGLSNGAGMTQLLACSLGEKITAVGGVAGFYMFPWAQCEAKNPIPAMLFHGTGDEIVPYFGGFYERTGENFPVLPEFAENWAARNGCDLQASETQVSPSVTRSVYNNCDAGADVALYTIENGGHSWPGGCCLPKWIVGETTQEIDASALMWAFYQEQSNLR
jgi:polyhydroxybutyrate depolymerase